MQKVSFIVMALGVVIGIISLILYFRIPSVKTPERSEPIAGTGSLVETSHQPPKPVENLPEVPSEVVPPEGEDATAQLPPDELTDPLIADKEMESPDTPEENPAYALLEEVFPEIGRIKRETYTLVASIDYSTATTEERTAYESKAKALETEIQNIGKRIAEAFPEAVTIVNFQGQDWVADIDFRKLQALAGDALPSSLEGYFRYASLQEMMRSPD